VVAWANTRETLHDIYRIAAVAAGSEETLHSQPPFAYFTSYESPLRHPKESIDNLLWAAEHDVPVVYLGGPTMGLESPATGASALVIHLAAVLSGLAIVQLHKPGAPMVVGGVPSAMDLRTARPAYGSPEMSLHAAAAAELAHHLGLPFMATAGASESKRLDSQAATEASIQVLMSALSGAALVHDAGFLDCADIGSLGMLVMLDEVIAMVRRIMFGLQVDKEAIMLDLIEKVGPGKYFITERQSNLLCRQEIWVPKLLDRNAFSIWEQMGARTMEMRVAERLGSILASHQPSALSEDQRLAITEILEQAEARERLAGE
jgi:trimethylamine--corrinoid protein Co-methyltransferase